ncbi:hypothetical protein AVEN_118792-1 [Araneus ventricosus]|uniref:Uncharacterized protein n=1 Tax=Araneus ventricosus TaxID=182803 RepID=A0A4Y2BWF3_ARAVE|nr:hypothetical protein AVEN_118792-1 [Araneus ventricosus]
MSDNWRFLCSAVSSAFLSWLRCALFDNQLFHCFSVSAALLFWPRCAITVNRLLFCSSVSSVLTMLCHSCQSAVSFFISFSNSPFTFPNCYSMPCNSSFSFRHRKKRELNKEKIVNSKYLAQAISNNASFPDGEKK